MSDRRARRRARQILGYWMLRGGARLVVRAGTWPGWKGKIASEVQREIDHALDRHYTFWRRAYVLDAMEPGRDYDTKELRGLSGVNRGQVKRTLRELATEGKVARGDRDGLWRLA